MSLLVRRLMIWGGGCVFILSMISMLLHSQPTTFKRSSCKSASPEDVNAIWLEVQLPSAIPPIYTLNQYHFLSKVDLRRADLALGIVDHDPIQHMQPLVDKVLVVPKSFTKSRT